MKHDDRVLDEDGNLGTVVISADDVITVTWDDGSTSEFGCEDDLFKDYLEIVPSELAADFDKISEKFLEAAKLIREGNAIAGNHELDFSGYKYFNVCNIGQLFGALNEAGWSTSSMMC